MFKGKKLLILGGASIHCKVVEAAKALGVYTIVTDYLVDSPAKLMADEKWMLNIMDIDEIVERCLEEKIDGVLSVGIDPCQLPYQKICEKLGVPCFGSEEQFQRLTDKRAFKEFCIQNGVDVIPEYTEEDAANGSIEYPVLIKPAMSRGSRGQTICYDSNGIEEAISFAKAESGSGDVVIEKFMGGKQDFSMTYVVMDGEPVLVRTGDRYLGKAEDGLNKQCVFSMSPSSHTDMYLANVDEKVKGFIRSLGLKNAPIFMQGFVDGETVRFYDPGLRFPGTEYEQLFYKATGTDLMKIMVCFALTGVMDTRFGEIENGYKLCGCHAVQMFVPAGAGTIAAFDGLDAIEAHPNVVAVSQRNFVGETVPASGDVRQRICEIVILVDETTTVSDMVSFVYSKLSVKDENGSDMLVSKVDPAWF